MPSLPDSSKTFFFHILKTGGVTFRSILSSLYGNSFQICYDPTIASIESSLRTARCLEFHTLQFEGRLTHMHAEIDRLDRWDLLEGHHCFTMLREPVDQAVSLFYHMQRKRPRVEKLYQRMGVAFPETLEQYLDGPHHFNTQTAFLANKQQLIAEHALSRADLDKAKDMLVRRRIHVGLMERFADSMNIFESVSGKTIPGDVVPIQNQNHGRPPLSEIAERLKDRIREQSALDVELHEFARELFLEELSRCQSTRRYTFVPAAPRAVEPETRACRRKTVFLHVMKTGGMTFRGILSSLYGDGFHVCADTALSSVKEQLAKYDCVEFHMMPQRNDWVALHAEVASENRWDLLEGMNIFTMLREPVEQIVSLYYFMVTIRKDIEPLMKASGVAFPKTIEEFLDHRENINNQTAFLVGKSQHGGRFVDRGDLTEAQRIVRDLEIHVGLTERFDDSLRVFQAVTGRELPPPSHIVIENRNKLRPPLQAIPLKVKDRIREESGLDLELYGFARERFAEDFGRYVQPARRFSFAGLRAPVAMQADAK